MERQGFLKTTGLALLATITGCRTKSKSPKSLYKFGYGYTQTNFLRPPGVVAEQKFLQGCINVIRLSHLHAVSGEVNELELTEQQVLALSSGLFQVFVTNGFCFCGVCG